MLISSCVWLLALVFVNWTVFAMRLICIERGQFCAKCMHIIWFTYVQIAKAYRDVIWGEFHPLRVLCELHNFFLSHLRKFSNHKDSTIFLLNFPFSLLILPSCSSLDILTNKVQFQCKLINHLKWVEKIKDFHGTMSPGKQKNRSRRLLYSLVNTLCLSYEWRKQTLLCIITCEMKEINWIIFKS